MDITQVYLSPSEKNPIKQDAVIRQILEVLSNNGTFFQGYLGGLTLSNDGVTPNSIVDIAKGTCVSDDQSTLMTLAAVTKTTTGTFIAGTGNGGLDSGTVGSSIWYNIYVIGGVGQSPDVLFSTSPTTPTMPSGFTVKRRIGSVLTSSTNAIIPFSQFGDEFLWLTPIANQEATAVSSTQTLLTVSVPVGVTVSWTGYASAVFGTTQDSIGFYSPVLSAQGNNKWMVDDDALFVKNATVSVQATYASIRTNTSSQIAASSHFGTAKATLVTMGWTDRRGRDS